MSNTYTIAGVVVDGNTAYECKKKAYIVQGMSLDWSMIEQGNSVLKGMVKPCGLFKDAEFCQRCSEIYSSVQSKLITHNESLGLNASGEPLRERERGNVKIMRHNNFKGYLEDAKKIFEKARVEYERLQDEWDATQKEYQRIQRDHHEVVLLRRAGQPERGGGNPCFNYLATASAAAIIASYCTAATTCVVEA